MDEKARIEETRSERVPESPPPPHPLDAGERDGVPPDAGSRNVDPLSTGKGDTVAGEREPRNVRPHADLSSPLGTRTDLGRESAGHLTSRLATASNGAVTRSRLLGSGVTRHVIDRRAAQGELHRVHRGVYIAGHLALAPLAPEGAALLACGEGSLISHRTAAAAWAILPPAAGDIDVTLVGRRCRPKAGVRIHLVNRMDGRDIAERDGIAITSPARTIVDLAAVINDDELERAISEARSQRILRHGEIEAALERAGHRRGVARMRASLRGESDSGYTRSKAERLLRRLLRAARLPQPVCNAPVGRYSADFMWHEHKLIVEVDSFQYHGHRSAFERDRRKDQALQAAGYRVIRVTWRQLTEQPLAVIAAIAAALAR